MNRKALAPRSSKNEVGFTLLELLVVIVILGILGGLISGNFFTSLKKGRDTKRKADLEQIQRALEMYYEDKRTYPTFAISFGSSLCETSGCAAGEKIYMQKLPNDPISSAAYQYLPAGDGTSYKIFACLENDQQILPYLSSGSSLVCSINCKKPDGTTSTPCLWGVSSSNVSP